eukprot:95096_1
MKKSFRFDPLQKVSIFRMDVPFHNTVTRAKLASTGFIRIHFSHIQVIPESITELCSRFVGCFFMDPNKDPSNFITQSDRQKALQLRQEGNALVQTKQWSKALKKYTESLSYDVNAAKTYSNRALCYLKLKDYDDAFSDARAAIHNDPLWSKAWLRLAQTFECMERYDECLNMLEHAQNICELNPSSTSKKQGKILEKYWGSIIIKKWPEEEIPEIVINHMEDADRLEWNHCEPGFVDESKMSDYQIMNALPFSIEMYEKGIAPNRLRKQLASRENMDDDCFAEYDRWTKRKWIQKVLLFKQLNHLKLLLKFEELVWDTPTTKGDLWTMTWSAEYQLYLNKRRVSIGISCVNFDDEIGSKDPDCNHHYNATVAQHKTWCKPNATTLINCIKMAILSPLDAVWHMMHASKNGEDMGFSRKPEVLEIQWRMKDEFEEIQKEMSKYGVFCRLGSLESNIESCKKFDTDPYGWNYLDMQPHYTFDKEHIVDGQLQSKQK